MQRDWTADELILHWTLQASEQALVGNKTGATRLGFAIFLKFFQFMGCFPQHAGEVPASAVEHANTTKHDTLRGGPKTYFRDSDVGMSFIFIWLDYIWVMLFRLDEITHT